MASVSSLDKDLARSRRAKYTPLAEGEVKEWLSSTLSEPVGTADLMDLLKDGSILCRLASLVDPSTPPLRFKKSAMPFVQMENIAIFLTFVSKPPVNLPPHDRFLTVDLYEKKDPAQVVQCLCAFSRIAHQLNPGTFSTTVGGLKAAGSGTMSPQDTGGSNGSASKWGGSASGGPAAGGAGANGKPALPTRKAATTAWSKREDEGKTAPAWNIAQYGYLGGASQGNQGINFGVRRQITSASPSVPKSRPVTPNTSSAAVSRARADAVELDRKREEEEAARRVEELRIQRENEENARLAWQREQDAKRERVREAEQEKLDELARREAEQLTAARNEAAQAKLEKEKLEREAERMRIKQLEMELHEAREREARYQAEKDYRELEEERKSLQGSWRSHKSGRSGVATPPEKDELPIGRALPTPPPRKLPPTPGRRVKRSDSWESNDDKLPISPGREDKERRAEEQRLKWNRMSLLERERERERERQKEWERNQQETEELAKNRDPNELDDETPAWNTAQYGSMRGADQGKMGVAFGSRRQIIGPRGPGKS